MNRSSTSHPQARRLTFLQQESPWAASSQPSGNNHSHEKTPVRAQELRQRRTKCAREQRPQRSGGKKRPVPRSEEETITWELFHFSWTRHKQAHPGWSWGLNASLKLGGDVFSYVPRFAVWPQPSCFGFPPAKQACAWTGVIPLTSRQGP